MEEFVVNITGLWNSLIGGMGFLGMLGTVAEIASKIILVFVLIKAYVALDTYIKNNRR